MTTKLLLLLCALIGSSGCQSKAPAAADIRAVATLEEVMHHMVIPNAEVVWDSVGTIYTPGRVEERQPRTFEQWVQVEAAATILTEAGNLLLMEGRAKPGNWGKHAQALREAGASLHQAAKARDAAAVFERGGVLFEACQGCHFEYRFEKDEKTIRTH